MKFLKEAIGKIPIIGDAARQLYWRWAQRDRKPEPFPGSAEYWEKRYSAGGNSGVGSYSHFAEFKAEVLNPFVATHDVKSVIEFGCGDGNQLTLAKYPSYLGLDVSASAIARCRETFKADLSKSFLTMSDTGTKKRTSRCHWT